MVRIKKFVKQYLFNIFNFSKNVDNIFIYTDVGPDVDCEFDDEGDRPDYASK